MISTMNGYERQLNIIKNYWLSLNVSFPTFKEHALITILPYLSLQAVV